MAKSWPTPRHMERRLADRAQRSQFTRVQTGLRTCKWCKGVFGTQADRDACESWHVSFFRSARGDVKVAIDRARRTLKNRDAMKPRDVKENQALIVSLSRKLDEFPDV